MCVKKNNENHISGNFHSFIIRRTHPAQYQAMYVSPQCLGGLELELRTARRRIGHFRLNRFTRKLRVAMTFLNNQNYLNANGFGEFNQHRKYLHLIIVCSGGILLFS